MEEQTENRKIQIYHRSLALMNAASNIFIQRVPASYVKRLIEHPDKVDPLSLLNVFVLYSSIASRPTNVSTPPHLKRHMVKTSCADCAHIQTQ